MKILGDFIDLHQETNNDNISEKLICSGDGKLVLTAEQVIDLGDTEIECSGTLVIR